MRFLPLTDACKRFLEEIQVQNPDNDYLFIRDSKPLSTVTFNRGLKKCCEELKIEYRSSHQIRFFTAWILYKYGATSTELQELLSHTSLTMTNCNLKKSHQSRKPSKKSI